MTHYDPALTLKKIDKEDCLDKLVKKYIEPNKSLIERSIFDLLAQKYQDKVKYEEGSVISFNGFTIEKITAHYKTYNVNEIEEAEWKIYIQYTYNNEKSNVADVPLFKIYTTGIENILLASQIDEEKSLANPCLVKEI